MATSADEFRKRLKEGFIPLNELRKEIEEAIWLTLEQGGSFFVVSIGDMPSGSELPVVAEYKELGWKVSRSRDSYGTYLEFRP